MRNRRLTYFILILLFSVTSIFLWQYLNKERDKSLTDKEYANKINKWLKDKHESREQAKTSKSAEQIAQQEKKQAWVDEVAQAQIIPINFHGRVVDQHNEPVAGVEIEFSAGSGYHAEGSGVSRVYTDKNGEFRTKSAAGASLEILGLSKPGYTFKFGDQARIFDNYKRFPDSNLWREYNENNPYPYNMWKIEESSRVIAGDKNYYFVPDGSVYSVDLKKNRHSKTRGSNKGSFNVSISHVSDGWKLELSVPNGGFIEADDTYMNLAPESGYQSMIVFDGPKGKNIVVNKKLYFQSQENQYGAMELEIWPYFNDKYAHVALEYTLNAEGKRHLSKAIR